MEEFFKTRIPLDQARQLLAPTNQVLPICTIYRIFFLE